MNPIAEFQKKHGLVADGVVGRKTLEKMMQVFGKTKEEICNFMGNGKIESMNFTRTRENMNYSAQRILDIFPYQFKGDLKLAKQYEYQSEKLANYVYDDKNRSKTSKLGNTIYGQGWFYRGVGGIQTTGFYNLQRLSNFLRDPEIMKNPDLVWQKYYFESMLFFFDDKKLWKHAKSVSKLSITALRQRVNGGVNGLNEVIEATLDYYNMLK